MAVDVNARDGCGLLVNEWGDQVAELPSGTSGRLRVLVCTATEAQRRGLTSMLELVPRVSVVEAVSPEALLRWIGGWARYDVLVVAMDSLDSTALRGVLTQVRAAGVHSVVLVRAVTDHVVGNVPGIVTDGFLLEGELTEQSLADALDGAVAGTMPMPGVLAGRLLTKLRRLESSDAQRPSFLSPVELSVLQLLGEGMANKQIASALDLSMHAVKRHVGTVLKRLNCPNRTLAVAYAMRRGLIDAESLPRNALAPFDE
ncbi:MAG: response regulator transcription factor [Actinocatenispora sp.]